jgi:GDP-L-fucose synthase
MIVAKQTQSPLVEIWGSGTPRREFLHADDLAEACFYLMKNIIVGTQFVNIGTGEDISIRNLHC